MSLQSLPQFSALKSVGLISANTGERYVVALLNEITPRNSNALLPLRVGDIVCVASSPANESYQLVRVRDMSLHALKDDSDNYILVIEMPIPSPE